MRVTSPLKVLLGWKLPRGIDRIETCMPGVEVAVVQDRKSVLASIGDAEVFFTKQFDAEMLVAAGRLRWVHSGLGGAESFLFPEFVASPVVLTCARSCFGTPGAELALCVMLAFARQLKYDIEQRPHRTFEPRNVFELDGKTVGIIGLGNIGLEIARRAHAFGMRVLGSVRRERPCPDDVDELFPRERLPELLAASDFVVVAVPATAATRGMIGASELGAMKGSAYLVDASGRAPVYDLEALRDALEDRRIAGAQLQTPPEPDSPLWELDNLLVSFHRATSREVHDRSVGIFCENLCRYREGQPLLGLVDKKSGY